MTTPAEAIDVRLTNGVAISAPGVGTVTADAAAPGADVNVVSHAHGDHLFDALPASGVVCSELTARLAAVRRDTDVIVPTSHDAIELLPSGHVAGATAALVESDVGTVLYTGDVSTRDRSYLSGFEPVDADVLIVESTYGRPGYVFPPHEEVEREISEWLVETHDSPAVCFGYALGKAQRVQSIVAASDRDRLFTTEAVLAINAVIEDALGVSFGAERYDDDVELGPGDVLVLPSQVGRFAWVRSLVADHGAVTAGFSGWASDRSYVHRRGVDRGFVLSDHCDFNELIALVEAVDPERVYTHHGFASDLAAELTRRSFDAVALKANQTSLGDF